MKCTVCKQGNLLPSFMDSLFRAHTCDHCGGNWILVEDFLVWKEQSSDDDLSVVVNYEEEILDSSKALLCPMTGSFMRKFNLSSKNTHRLDYSASVGGIWLDKGEWNLLKQEGLANDLNSLVTDSWQKKIKQENTEKTFRELYIKKFGEEAYIKLKQFREWLEDQPEKADMRAYLSANDPYSV